MPKYKLTYFNLRGRIEVSRLLFAQAGQEYEDHRIERDAWQALKPTTPFGQLPVFEVDGVVLCQSVAISRYLARAFGLAGKTDLDQAYADMIVDALEDMKKLVISVNTEGDEGKKAELKKKFSEEQLPAYLQSLEKLVKGDFFLGDEMTWADFALVEAVPVPSIVGVNIDLDKYPKLKAVKQRVETSPKIAEWIQKRPKTPY